jgi:hypothetical protein
LLACYRVKTRRLGGYDREQGAGKLMGLGTNLMKLRQCGSCTGFCLCVLMEYFEMQLIHQSGGHDAPDASIRIL